VAGRNWCLGPKSLSAAILERKWSTARYAARPSRCCLYRIYTSRDLASHLVPLGDALLPATALTRSFLRAVDKIAASGMSSNPPDNIAVNKEVTST
jgi:hypothetical protein